MPKLFGMSALVELAGFIAMLLFSDFKYSWLFLFVGFIYFGVMYSKYRNQGARHYHETETKKNVFNLRKQDNFIRHETGLSNSMMDGANNRKVSGTQKSKLLDL